MHLPEPLHIWLGVLLIVAPIPEPWVKFALALAAVVAVAVWGG